MSESPTRIERPLPAGTPEELRLDLAVYEGPLDMLLELIKLHEIDIFDIPIAFVTERYLAYVDSLQTLDLQVGGEWLELAAMLVYIKSRLLLPPDPTAPEDPEEGPDPREDLVRRLLEYQMYRMVADKLDERPQLSRDVFTPATRLKELFLAQTQPQLYQASLFDLMEALERVVEKARNKPAWTMEITREKLTLRSLILEIAQILQERPRMAFEALFENTELSRHRVVTTFLAILEMCRLKMIRLFQARLTENTLYVERAVVDLHEVSLTLELERL